jgi:hypothetical protein
VCAPNSIEGSIVQIAAARHNLRRVAIDTGHHIIKPPKHQPQPTSHTGGGKAPSRATAPGDPLSAEGDAAHREPRTNIADPSPDPVKQLQILADLRDRGVITDDELNAQKRRRLLSRRCSSLRITVTTCCCCFVFPSSSGCIWLRCARFWRGGDAARDLLDTLGG